LSETNVQARADILARIRAGVGKPDAAQRKAAALARLQQPVSGPQPADLGDLVVRFRDRATALASSCVAVPDEAAVPAAIARYLGELGLPRQAVISPEISHFPWSTAGFSVAARAAVDADLVGISGCFCGIAETGTLMLLSGPQSPASVSLLPETHIALLPVTAIVPTMEAAFARWRADAGPVPRAINFVSGPSRTGDIEQTIVLGAHGPCRVHIVLIGLEI
jgi:L-lactate dehydrogenase complex protein LldG